MKTTLIIIAAVCLSGAVYGQPFQDPQIQKEYEEGMAKIQREYDAAIEKIDREAERREARFHQFDMELEAAQAQLDRAESNELLQELVDAVSDLE